VLMPLDRNELSRVHWATVRSVHRRHGIRG